MPPKTHRTSVVVIPPQEVWEPIQAIRRQHDRQIHRWMPHVNLLYPFLPREQFDLAVPRLTAACQQVPAFDAILSTFRSFTHASGRSTLWLAPEPQALFAQLQEVLHTAFPDYDDQSRFAGGFTPHLSVGQVASRRELRSLTATLQAEWQPLPFSIAAVALIWREADGPFQVEHWLSLSHTASCGEQPSCGEPIGSTL
jgi:RNA 2',3'-cyclic 3'-phosphodiesterase